MIQERASQFPVLATSLVRKQTHTTTLLHSDDVLFLYFIPRNGKEVNLNAEGKAKDIVSQPVFLPSIPSAEEGSRDSRNDLGLCELYLQSYFKKEKNTSRYIYQTTSKYKERKG